MVSNLSQKTIQLYVMMVSKIRFVFTCLMQTNIFYLIQQDLDRLKEFLTINFGKNVETQKMAVNGWNWGKVAFGGRRDL
jgi:hypothetical protein